MDGKIKKTKDAKKMPFLFCVFFILVSVIILYPRVYPIIVYPSYSFFF